MGGTIQLASTPGAGSTFSFTLDFPVLQHSAAADPSDPITTLTPCPVLVVDDNPVAGELTLMMVRSWGWDAEWVSSGAAALQRATQATAQGMDRFAFPVIFMDWQMPDWDGWETTRRLRALADQLGVPAPTVIMVTAHARESLSHRSQAEQDMVAGFLVKPVTASMLGDALMAAARGNASVRCAPSHRSGKQQLAGMRVLLVDDNLINQQVADELLSAEGAVVSLASNGLLAVQAVAAAAPPYDIVLMDIQMPVLDGYGATRRIRNELGLHHLPIVAMTANAMSSDRAVCLAAGMNEHVGKPFDVAHLVSIMLRMTGRQGLPDPTPATLPAVPTLPTEASVPLVEGLDLANALARMADLQPLYVRAAQDFCAMLRNLPTELAQLLSAGDLPALAMRLHTLKGNAGTLGALELGRMAAALEKTCKSEGAMAACAEEIGGLNACIQHTANLMEQAIAALSQQPPHKNAAPPPSQQAGSELDDLRHLSALTAAGDLDALLRFAEVRDRLRNAPAEFVDALELALQNLDLNAAHALCESQIARSTPAALTH
jgi:CheY-like chemotaxis protein